MSATDDMMGVVEAALGTPYLWGGNIVGQGLDCSGFTTAVYAAAGISLPRVSNAQARFGSAVSAEEAQVGDLVWWDLNDRNDGADHIGIYIGNGMVAESAPSQGGVKIRKLWGNAQFTRVKGAPAGGGQGAAFSEGQGGQGGQGGTANKGAPTDIYAVPGATLSASPGASLMQPNRILEPGAVGQTLQGKSLLDASPYDMQQLYAQVETTPTSEDGSTVGPYGVAKAALDRENFGFSGLDKEISKYQMGS